MKKYDALFTPFKIGKCEIKNRYVMCAMGGSALVEHGKFHDKALDYYIERAKGGVGLIIPGVAHITDMWGRGGWLYEDLEKYVQPIKKMMDEIHSYDAKLFLQITAGMGRVLQIQSGMLVPNANLDNAMYAPSGDMPNVWAPEKTHRELAKEEIHNIIDAFAKSAKLAKEAGIDGIEVHAVHEGYLLDQFAIASMNHRTDEYGGTLENRLRFTGEIIKAIKEACGVDYPVMVRYSVASKMKGFNDGAVPGEAYVEYGRSLEESPAVARILEKAGCDALNADNGTYDSWYWAHPPVYMGPACNLPDVAFIKNYVDIPVICAGRMEDPDIALKAIESGTIDGVGIARQLLADPAYPNKVKAGDIENIRPCIACHNGCYGMVFAGKEINCAVNPCSFDPNYYNTKPADDKKKVVVVGGGIGGMEAARMCALRGHDVVLFEKTDKLGGVFIAAAAPDFKESDKKLIKWYIKQVNDLSNIEIRMNTEATLEDIKKINPDNVIIATGSKAKQLPIVGIESPNVVEAIDLLVGNKPVGDNVVVIGGGLTGCEIAYDLASKGKNVSIVEMMEDILSVPGLPKPNGQMLRDLLKYNKVNIYTSSKTSKITPTEVIISREGNEISLAADTVVTAVGYNSYNPIADKDFIDGLGNVNVIGDADHVGNLLNVIWKAYEVAAEI